MTCWVCGEAAVHEHHVVTRQVLRREAQTTGRNYTELVADPTNRIPLCLSCHAAHHNRTRPIPAKALPDEAIQFAKNLMGAGRAYNFFTRHYLGIDPRVEALDELWGDAA